MTRLLAPNPGEIADRSTILKLKINFALEKHLTYEHFRGERDALDVYLQEMWHRELTQQTKNEYFRLFEDLFKVNKKLWDAEDEIRVVRKRGVAFSQAAIEQLAALAVIITEQNDVRSNLVRQINSLYGIKEQEKLYQCATTK
jgi:hypothetical protein